MSNAPRLRSGVVRAREILAQGRAKLREQHAAGSLGVQVCARLTELLDEVVLGLYHEALAEIGPPVREPLDHDVALVALGGYGRRDVAPFSDVDLMLLHAPGTNERVAPLARRLMTDLCDVNLEVGHSLRTPAEALALALQDGSVFTSLVEARLLAGNMSLFERFAARFRRLARRSRQAILHRIEQSRGEERRQFGETVFLLEPNIKRSRGALRDIQYLRWVGFARYGERDPEALALAGLLTKEEERRLLAAREFLLHVRNELHFHRGKAHDLLDRGEQVRVAQWLQYAGTEAVLPVERLMRDYFEHTNEVRAILSHFLEGARRSAAVRKVVGFLFSHQVEGDFRVGPYHIAATRRGRKKLCGDPAEVLRLLDLANYYSKSIEYETWQAIRAAMAEGGEFKLSPEAAERFLSLMGQSGPLGEALRRLHELRVLEKIVPGMAHARCLMQFNDYHKYTVDEHSLRAVEQAVSFAQRADELGIAYRGIKQKRTLHLALLIHDLGKGFTEDHSEVGARLADELAERLKLPAPEGETLRFLVLKHLLMAHLALWRDTSDNDVVVRFAVEVGSPEVLQMLYVLTCADLAAVGPDVLNDWKLQLLTGLYRRAMVQLAGDETSLSQDERLAVRRGEVLALVRNRAEPQWWHSQVEALPVAYLLGSEPEQILAELDRIRQLPRREAMAWGRVLPQQNAVEYTVGTHEEIVPGIFHRLTGALSSKGMQILTAEIHTLPDSLVLDRFYVSDADFSGPPPPARIEEVCQALVAALRSENCSEPTFRRLWRTGTNDKPRSRLPSRVRIDNNTSERYTIIDVFAHDRMGLLYAITRTLFELGLSVHGARIGTHLDQVVDVFYVTDGEQRKLSGDERLAEVRSRLQQAIEPPAEGTS